LGTVERFEQLDEGHLALADDAIIDGLDQQGVLFHHRDVGASEDHRQLGPACL
jgi:hypothetical protein